MPFHVRDAATDKAARELAARTGRQKNKLRRLNQAKRPLAERIQYIQTRELAYKPTGLSGDKAFYDQ